MPKVSEVVKTISRLGSKNDGVVISEGQGSAIYNLRQIAQTGDKDKLLGAIWDAAADNATFMLQKEMIADLEIWAETFIKFSNEYRREFNLPMIPPLKQSGN